MHELSIMGNILDIVLQHAEKNNARKVMKVNLKIGILSDVIPEWAQKYFEMLSKDTIADNAELIIEKVPARIKCNNCGFEYEFTKENWQFSCTRCDSSDIELLSGREMTVTSIEIE